MWTWGPGSKHEITVVDLVPKRLTVTDRLKHPVEFWDEHGHDGVAVCCISVFKVMNILELLQFCNNVNECMSFFSQTQIE
jgi:hypothetical protein